MLNYNVKAVNIVTKHVAEVAKTVSSHGKFIVEQGQYNDDAETDKANCTLIIKDLEKLEITLSEGQRGKQMDIAIKRSEKFLKDNCVDTKGSTQTITLGPL